MNKYIKWYKMSLELAELKKKEATLRRELCAELFEDRVGDFKVEKETKTFSLVAHSKVTKSLDEDDLKAMWQDLTPEEKRAVKWKPTLVAKFLAHVPEDSELYEAITEKPAMPTIKLTVKV